MCEGIHLEAKQTKTIHLAFKVLANLFMQNLSYYDWIMLITNVVYTPKNNHVILGAVTPTYTSVIFDVKLGGTLILHHNFIDKKMYWSERESNISPLSESPTRYHSAISVSWKRDDRSKTGSTICTEQVFHCIKSLTACALGALQRVLCLGSVTCNFKSSDIEKYTILFMSCGFVSFYWNTSPVIFIFFWCVG